jgi:peptide/nickel transport system permease protein
MIRYVVGRFAAVLPVLFVISVIAFGLQAITPGDPAILLLQASGMQNVTPAIVVAKRAELHLDDPLVVRYFDWLRG